MNTKRVYTVRARYNVDNVAQLAEVQKKRVATFAAKRSMMYYEKPAIDHIIDGHSLTVYKIHKRIADDWLNRYHPCKAPKGNILCLGLVKGDQLLCLMTFKKARNKKYVAEMSRMWTLSHYYIIDGYDILSRAASEYGLYNIVAYVDLLYENEEDYKQIGMKRTGSIQKTRWWCSPTDKITDASRRQKHLSIESMRETGYLPMYDCGQAVYEFKH